MSDELPPLGKRVLIQWRILNDSRLEIASRQPTTIDPEGGWAWLTDRGHWHNPEEVEKWAELPVLGIPGERRAK